MDACEPNREKEFCETCRERFVFENCVYNSTTLNELAKNLNEFKSKCGQGFRMMDLDTLPQFSADDFTVSWDIFSGDEENILLMNSEGLFEVEKRNQ